MFDKPLSTKAVLDLEMCLARWHIKLARIYKNEHDENLTYIRPSGAMQLTPAMVLDWAWALVCTSKSCGVINLICLYRKKGR